MKRLTITLSDGQHILKTPTWRVLVELKRMGVKGDRLFNFADEDGNLDFEAVAIHLAAMLMDSEPDEGWDLDKAASLMPPSEAVGYITVLDELGADAFPASDEDAPKVEGSTQ